MFSRRYTYRRRGQLVESVFVPWEKLHTYPRGYG
jgi:hypothetical protein